MPEKREKSLGNRYEILLKQKMEVWKSLSQEFQEMIISPNVMTIQGEFYYQIQPLSYHVQLFNAHMLQGHRVIVLIST